jgi:hypothetical protein
MKDKEKETIQKEDKRNNDYYDFYIPYVPVDNTPSCDVVICDCPCDCGC